MKNYRPFYSIYMIFIGSSFDLHEIYRLLKTIYMLFTGNL